MDDESETYWDHITGEAVHGQLAGTRLNVWGIQLTTAGAMKSLSPDLPVHRSRQGIRSGLITWFMNLPFADGWFPPGFRQTMGVMDTRLEEMSLGLGVVTVETQRFYLRERIGAGIEDQLDGQPIRIGIGDVDAVPYAVWLDGSRPLQLFSRWYGFSLTYPGCTIYSSAGQTP